MGLVVRNPVFQDCHQTRLKLTCSAIDTSYKVDHWSFASIFYIQKVNCRYKQVGVCLCCPLATNKVFSALDPSMSLVTPAKSDKNQRIRSPYIANIGSRRGFELNSVYLIVDFESFLFWMTCSFRWFIIQCNVCKCTGLSPSRQERLENDLTQLKKYK